MNFFKNYNKRIRSIGDNQYRKYLSKRVLDIIYMNVYIKKLYQYHRGKKYDFTNFSEKQLLKILKYAANNSSYYRDIIQPKFANSLKPIEIIENLPFLDKDIIRKHDKEIAAIDIQKDFIGHLTTGGSTGQPLGFYTLGGHDFEHQKFLYKIMGYEKGDKILAMDGAVVPDYLLEKQIYWVEKSEKDLPYGSVSLSAHYLRKDTIDKYISFLQDFKPQIIRGYPSFIWDLSKYILKNQIKICFELKGVEVTSESYFEYQILDIEKAFNTKVFSQYGHAEASVFGYTIDTDMMSYCSPLYGYTEVIDSEGKHVRKGEVGEIVVTGFFNYAMPFIRYRTGDMAKYHDTKDGIVQLERIYGRTQDYIYTRDHNKILLTALVFGSHYKAFNNIKKWQIVQNIPGEITFRMQDSELINEEDMNELKESFYRVAKIKTSFEFVKEIPLTLRGKSKFLIQNLNMED